jgi:hypothetical protein
LTLIDATTHADDDVGHDDLEIGPMDSQWRFRRGIIDHQFREHRQARHALGHHQIAFAYLLAPIVNLPAGRAMLVRNIGHRHAGHHAFRRDPCPLCLRAPPPATWPLDHFQPGNPNTFRAVQMDAHFAVYFQNPNPPSCTCAQNGRIRSEMAGGGRRCAYDHRSVFDQ